VVPNIFAYAMLYLWPVIAGLGFRALPLNRAIICSSLAGFLLLPSAVTVELPGLPDLSKNSIILIGIITAYVGHRRPRRAEMVPRSSLFMMALLFASALGTVLTNGDPLLGPRLYIPNLTLYDMLGATFNNILIISVVVIGTRTLSRKEDHREMLLLLGAAMILYSVPALLEIRISPQFHKWVYGIYPANFDQQMRGGGYRSTVFMSHGLVLAWFLAMAITALMALRRSKVRLFKGRVWAWSAYLWVVLFFQKSFGALMLGGVMCLALLMRPSRQIGFAAAVAMIFLAYPAVRGMGLIPVDWIHDKVAEYSTERAGSFGTRLTNEKQLMAKANERPLFGWGGWGRAWIYHPVTGRNMSIADGAWIIILGCNGWVGYLAHFGLICMPLLGLYRYRRKIPTETAGVAIILSGNLIDMIPNSSLTPITWLTAGALTGALAAARRGTRISRAPRGYALAVGMKPVGMKPALASAAPRGQL